MSSISSRTDLCNNIQLKNSYIETFNVPRSFKIYSDYLISDPSHEISLGISGNKFNDMIIQSIYNNIHIIAPQNNYINLWGNVNVPENFIANKSTFKNDTSFNTNVNISGNLIVGNLVSFKIFKSTDVSFNNLDISNNLNIISGIANLQTLKATDSSFNNLDISNNLNIKYGFSNLQKLKATDSSFNNLDISNNLNIKFGFSNLQKLKATDVSFNNLDISNNLNVKYGFTNLLKIAATDVSFNNLDISNNLNILSGFTNLQKLKATDVSLNNLDISNNLNILSGFTNLQKLKATDVSLNNLDISNNFNILGNVTIKGTLKDTTSLSGSLGQILASTGTGIQWIPITQISGNNAIITLLNGFFSNTIGTNASQNSVSLAPYAGNYNQGYNAIAIGVSAGSISQGNYSINIGNNAGNTNSSNFNNYIIFNASAGKLNPIASNALQIAPIRNISFGITDQLLKYNTITNEITYTNNISAGNITISGILSDISFLSGTYGQILSSTINGVKWISPATYLNNNNGLYTSATGNNAGINSVSLGINAGNNNQNINSIAIGNQAGYSSQGSNSIAIGNMAGYNNAGNQSINIGYSAGFTNISNYTNYIIINTSGSNINPIASNSLQIGSIRNISFGITDQLLKYNTFTNEITYTNNISAGNITINGLLTDKYTSTGLYKQYLSSTGSNVKWNTLPILINQSGGIYSTTLGTNAGQNSISLGPSAGFFNQSYNSIALGFQAGEYSQLYNSIAIGNNSGLNSQSQECIAIGDSAGYNAQQINAIAIGQSAGNTLQGIKSIAIGLNAGNSNQGKNSICIGENAGNENNSSYSNYIIINASANIINPIKSGAFQIAPLRNTNFGVTDKILKYDISTNEVSYSNNIIIGGTLTDKNSSVGYSGQLLASTGNGISWITATNTSSAFITISNGFYSNTLGTYAGQNAISLGVSAGSINQGSGCIAIGHYAGNYNQGYNSIALGRYSSYANISGYTNYIILNAAGYPIYPIASNALQIAPIRPSIFGINDLFLKYNPTTNEICTSNGIYVSGNITDSFGSSGYNGYLLSSTTTNVQWIAPASIITKDGFYSNLNSTSIGYHGIAIGSYAGEFNSFNNTGDYAVAIGYRAGANQQFNAIALGNNSGNSYQGANSIAIGSNAGVNQDLNCIAIGNKAGYCVSDLQGQNSICLGNNAGAANPNGYSNYTIINSSSNSLNPQTSNAFYVNPIRSTAAGKGVGVLFYNPTTSEIQYSTT